MNKNKFYVLVIVALFISNGVLVFFMTQKGHWGKQAHSPKEIIIERLRLDEAQIKDYSELVLFHGEATRDLMKSIRTQRSSIYKLLTVTDSTAKVDSAINAIGGLQQELELINFDHFQDIKALCTAEQLKDFESLSNEFVKIFGERKGKPNHGPKR
ncbi:hypothetical protein N8371_01195 [Vicingaceae bacterium]|nr:hypothetical protein [Vicingaceae bacterium]